VSELTLETLKSSAIQFTGDLTRHTVMASVLKKMPSLTQSASLTLDLSKVSKVDTAGLAWLLMMVETALKRNCQLQLDNLPDDLLKLAALSGVTEFLPVSVSNDSK